MHIFRCKKQPLMVKKNNSSLENHRQSNLNVGIEKVLIHAWTLDEGIERRVKSRQDIVCLPWLKFQTQAFLLPTHFSILSWPLVCILLRQSTCSVSMSSPNGVPQKYINFLWPHYSKSHERVTLYDYLSFKLITYTGVRQDYLVRSCLFSFSIRVIHPHALLVNECQFGNLYFCQPLNDYYYTNDLV